MGFTAAAVAMAGTAAYSGERQKKAAQEQAEATRQAAELQAAEQKRQAEEQRKQAEENARIQKQQEAARDAERRRMEADADAAGLADKTPNVELAATAGTASTEARKRRADFRPTYSSGITI